MQVTVERGELARVLGMAAEAAAANQTGSTGIAALRGAQTWATIRPDSLDHRLIITGTDLDRRVQANIPCQVGQVGTVCPNAHDLAALVARLNGDKVTLTREGEDVRVVSGSTKATVRGFDPGDYPQTLEQDADTRFTVEREWFETALGMALPAVSDQEHLGIAGVWVHLDVEGRVRVIGTDGHRLAFSRRTIEFGDYETPGDGRGVIIPAKGVKAILTACRRDPWGKDTPAEEKTCEVEMGENVIRLTWPGCTVSSILMAQAYPNIDRLIQKFPPWVHRAGCQRDTLVDGLRTCALSSNKAEHKGEVYLSLLDADHLRLYANTPEFGEISHAVEVLAQGGPVHVCVDGRLVADALAALDKTTITVQMEAHDKPVRFLQDEDRWTLVSPRTPNGYAGEDPAADE